jgi:hypothetical protein
MVGIAMQFQSQFKDEYLAGLWLKNIEAQLLWQVHSFGCSRPAKYRAPPWSWASLDGKIELPGLNMHSLEFDRVKETIAIRVADFKIQPTVPSQPFGQIQSASLRIECPPLKQAFLQWSKVLDYWPFIQTEAGPRRVGYRIDIGAFVATDVLCLMLVTYTNSSSYVPHGLILSPTGHKGEYKRLGIFHLLRNTNNQDVATLYEFFSAPDVEGSDAYCNIEKSSFRRRKLKYYVTLV